MENFFNPEGSVMRALSRIADLAILNILWLLCSIPVVTAGAATTALYYMTVKMVKNEEGYLVRGFFKAFRENFKKATIVWLLLLVVSFVLGADFYIMCHWQSMMRYPMLVLILMAALVLAFVAVYVFMLIGTFENTLIQYVKNAFFMSIRHLPFTILLVGIVVIQFFVCNFMVVNSEYIPLVLLFGMSVFAYAMSFVYVKVLKHYIAPEDDN